MASEKGSSFGRGNLLKSLANQTSNQHYDIWSRGSRSLPARSPTLLARSPFNASQDETLEEFNASDYSRSVFPSLFHKFDTKYRPEKLIQRTKTQSMQETSRNLTKQKNHQLSFFDELQRRNESHYLRIQSIAKEQMAMYEKNAKEMEDKIKRQREEMQKKAQLFLDKLADQEAKRKEEKIYSSSYGRIWRHHRVMQRRALNLEPMESQSGKVSDSGIT